jgi:hypothetical protein
MYLLLTDNGSYDLASDHQIELPLRNIWMVHFGGYPVAYEDQVLKVLERGGISNSVEESLEKFYWRQQGLELQDGYLWQVTRTAQEHQVIQPGAPIAAKYLINHLLATRTDKDQNETLQLLDKIHNLAKQYPETFEETLSFS